MPDFQQVETSISDSIRRDHYGRYLLPDPETGREQAWTRVTTIAGTLKDRFGLEQWDQRNIVYGMGQRPELFAQAAAATLDDRDALTKIAARAKEAASSKAGADIGSALHTFTERIDRGEEVSVPPPYDRDVNAYVRACKVAEMTVVPEGIERIGIIPEIGAVGTLDRLNAHVDWPLPRIGDIKTATDKVYNGRVTNTVLAYGMVDIPLQLAMYAHATHWWTGKGWEKAPQIDQSRAMVMHVPVGLGECRIYEIDIEAGWEAVSHALWDRAWRKRKGLGQVWLAVDFELPNNGSEGGASTDAAIPTYPSDCPLPQLAKIRPKEGDQASRQNGKAGKGGEAFSTPLAADPPASGPSSVELPEHIFFVRLAWLRDRVNAIKLHSDARARLAQLWSNHDHIPTFPKGGPRTDNELSVIAGLCGLVEMEFSLPFPREPDPAEPELNIKEQRAQWKNERKRHDP